MAIVKLKSGTFQVKLRGPDGKWISKAFDHRKDAETYEIDLKNGMKQGVALTCQQRSLTLDQYFPQWFETVKSRASEGWRREQMRLYRVYISPHLGNVKLEAIPTPLVARVLNNMAAQGKAEQTRLHVFNLMRKLLGDAIEIFRLLTYNPVQRSLKPKVPQMETLHLTLPQIKELLISVQGKPYDTAIWLQLCLGLRVGELQALRWEDVNLINGILHIRTAYVRRENVTRNYPKGRKQHSHRIPSELWQMLNQEKLRNTSEFVALGPSGERLCYEWYCRTLKRYCKALGLPPIGTHGLRHSTSEIYMTHGASRDDIRQLFAHSSDDVTARYIHQRSSHLEQVAQVIKLFG